MSVLWAFIAVASAAELDEQEAERLARMFYALTGRNAPEAFLGDDIEVLLESGRDADELEEAVRWIALNVDGAESYTLSGLLESHLARALGEEEELVLPPMPESSALGKVERGPRFEADPLFCEEVLDRFYTATDRQPPTPPSEEDLAAFERLSRNYWSADGMLRLAEWVPENVNGAEQLSWAQVADVAVEKGYNGGPRPDGQLEELVGVRVYPGTETRSLFLETDARSFDGGVVVRATSFGALPTRMDFNVARLAGSPWQVAEAAVGMSAGHVQLAQGRENLAFNLVGRTGWAPSTVLGGQAGLATRQGFLGVGGTVWGLQGGPLRDVGVSVALDQNLNGMHFTQDIGLSGRREFMSELWLEGQTLHGEFAPWIPVQENAVIHGRVRLDWTTGGLVEDAGGIGDDVYRRLESQVGLGLLLMRPARTVGLRLDVERDAHGVRWIERDAFAAVVHETSDAWTDVSMAVAAEAALPWVDDLWLSGGLDLGQRWYDTDLDPAFLWGAALGGRKLVRHRLWVGAALEVGAEPHAQISASMPF